MTKEIMEKVHEINTNFEELKKDLKQSHEQMASKEHVDALLKEKMDRINDAITVAEDAKEAAERAEAMAKARRVMADEKESKYGTNPELRKAFAGYIRKGEEGLSSKENEMLQLHSKSLSSGSDPAGGYVVMPEMDNNITRIIYETSPMRQYAEVKQIGTDQFERLQRTDNAASGWADRDESDSNAPTTTPTWKKLSLKAWKLWAEPAISQDLIDDAFIDVEAELTMSLAQSFELLENTAFFTGTGVGQPRGILTYGAGSWNAATPNSPDWGTIEQINSGDASNLTYAGIINLVYALKDGYLSRARFMANRLTVGKLRLMVDGIGQALWTPGFGSEPATFMGYPIVRAADMPTVQASALALAFGDFSRAYMVVDRMGTRVLRDPYTSKPFVKFYTTKRTGGGVINFEAVKLQKVSA
jgi:HK97 family phage major capsid protein